LLQALSWTLFERVTFDRTRVTSVDWSAYPILRFGDVPHSIEVHIIDRPGDGFFGVAEAAQRPVRCGSRQRYPQRDRFALIRTSVHGSAHQGSDGIATMTFTSGALRNVVPSVPPL
jgi:hypothetical protein